MVRCRGARNVGIQMNPQSVAAGPTGYSFGCPDCGSLLGEYHKAACPRSSGPGATVVTSISPGPFELLTDLRRAGWKVAVHNDYSYKGQVFTFWLFTHGTGVFVKGEGATDLDALRDCISEIKRRKLQGLST